MPGARKQMRLAVAVLLAFSSLGAVKTFGQQEQTGSQTIIERLGNKPSGPAPKRDLNGVWTGPVDSIGQNFPPFTPEGEERFKMNKPEPIFHLANTNDPLATCDPLGFPRNVLNETRGMQFIQLPDRMMIIYQYQKTWRQAWTDGRPLPTKVDVKGGISSNFYGYSVGHWDGDYTFVVDTVGLDDRSWLDKAGHPHSNQLHVTERYTRVDHDSLHMTVTIDDPTIYTRKFDELQDITFKWLPSQSLDEQICVPSEGIAYMNIIGKPAGSGTPPK